MAVTLLRRALPFLGIALLAALLYDGWIFYSRWSYARRAERAREDGEQRQARATIDMLGGGGLKILSFYASPQVVPRGGSVDLCYGVMGAKTVHIEPPVEDLHPAVSYCLQVSPARQTEYKLTAQDAAGHTATASVLVKTER